MPEVPIPFPLGGLNDNLSFSDQPPTTTREAVNMRAIDPNTGRIRGAQRSGLSQYITATVGAADKKVAHITSISKDENLVTYALRSESEIDTPDWSKTTPSKRICRNIKTDLQGNVYALDGNAGYVKYNSEGTEVYRQAAPVPDQMHVCRGLALDDVGGVYLSVSEGGDQGKAKIFHFVEELDPNVTTQDEDPCRGEQDPKVTLMWEITPGSFIEDIVVWGGVLYTIQNNPVAREAYLVTYGGIAGKFPFEEVRRRTPFPSNGLAVRGSDGAIFVCSPPDQQDRRTNTHDPSYQVPVEDFTPRDLTRFEDRVWAWYDVHDLEGFADNDIVDAIPDKSGNGRDLFLVDPAADDDEKPRYQAKGIGGKPSIRFPGAIGQALESFANPTSGPVGSGRTSIPGDDDAGFAIFATFQSDDGTTRRCLFSQPNTTGIDAAGSPATRALALGINVDTDWAYSEDQINFAFGRRIPITASTAADGTNNTASFCTDAFAVDVQGGTFTLVDPAIKAHGAGSSKLFIHNTNGTEADSDPSATESWQSLGDDIKFVLGRLYKDGGGTSGLINNGNTSGGSLDLSDVDVEPFVGLFTELIVLRNYTASDATTRIVEVGIGGGSGTVSRDETSEWRKLEGYMAWRVGAQQYLQPDGASVTPADDHPYVGIPTSGGVGGSQSHAGTPKAQDPDKPEIVFPIREDREGWMVQNLDGMLVKFAPTTAEIVWIARSYDNTNFTYGGIGYGVTVGCDGNLFSVGPHSVASGVTEGRVFARRIIDNGDTYAIIPASGAGNPWQAFLYDEDSADQELTYQYLKMDVDKQGNVFVPIYDSAGSAAAYAAATLYVFQQEANTIGGSQHQGNDPIRTVNLTNEQLGIACAVDRNIPNYRADIMDAGHVPVGIAERVLLATDNKDLTDAVTDGDYVDGTPATFEKTGAFTNYTFTVGDTITTEGDPGADVTPNTYTIRDRVSANAVSIIEDAGTATAGDVPWERVAYRNQDRKTVHSLLFVSSDKASSSTSPRSQVVLAVADDGAGSLNIFKGDATGDTWTEVTAGQDMNGGTEYVDSTVAFGRVLFTDGVNYKVFEIDPNDNTESVADWKAKSGGRIPERGRLLTTWRGRVVLARFADDPGIWAMSAVGDPYDWDFFPPIPQATAAVFGPTSRAGGVSDSINAIASYNDDLLFFGGDRSIWRLTGDPNAGGQLDLITDVTGMAFGRSWTKDPQGVLYFAGSRGGVFAMTPSGKLERISKHSIERRLQNINFGNFYTELIWNYEDEGLHVFVIPFEPDPSANNTGLITHWFWDHKTSSWWEDQFGSSAVSSGRGENVQPTAVSVLDSDASDDRTLVMGGYDGLVRKWDKSSKNDDFDDQAVPVALPIDSRVLVGPISLASAGREAMVKRFTPVLASDLDGCRYEFYLSDEPDNEGTPWVSGDLLPGRNETISARDRGSYLWLKLRNAGINSRWAFESATAWIASAGPKRARARR